MNYQEKAKQIVIDYYNGDKKETYLDAYKKWENVCVKDEED